MEEHEQNSEAPPEEEPVKESQEEPQEDSGLQTPQPDQPFPTEAERETEARHAVPPASPPVSATRTDQPLPSPPVDSSYRR